MTKPLDGTAFHIYSRRLGFPQQTQELLTSVRSSPPNRTPSNHYGNMPVWYPSKKMQCIIKAESHKVEFAFLLEAEHDDNVLEIWDQPPAIPLEYQDRRGRLHGGAVGTGRQVEGPHQQDRACREAGRDDALVFRSADSDGSDTRARL